MSALVISLLFALFSAIRADDVQGCGGYVKSDVEINFSQVGIKLYTTQGSLKYETDCAPNDGYYFIPVYDKGNYVIKVAPPSGWSVEPSEVPIQLDGETDPCSKKEDINFYFKGFAVLGQVSSGGVDNSKGPAKVIVSLSRSNNLVQTTQTDSNGRFVFTPLAAGQYSVSATHPSWTFIKNSASVSIKDANGEVPQGSLVVKGYSVTGSIIGESSSSMAGAAVVLHLEDGNLFKYYVENPPGCIHGPPKGYENCKLCGTGPALCHVLADAQGRYSFSNIAPGQYTFAVHYATDLTQYVVSPSSMQVRVQHGDAKVQQNFMVEGFKVWGEVREGSSGAPISGASVTIPKLSASLTTDQHGRFSLDSVKSGKYNIIVEHPEYEFSSMIASVSGVSPKLDTIMPSRYQTCFRVLLDKGSTTSQGEHWSVAVKSVSSDSVALASVSDSGIGCLMLVPGEYVASVQLTEQQDALGVRFGPPEHAFTVTNKVTKPFTFSQFLGEITVTVQCLQECPLEINVVLAELRKNGAVKSLAAKPIGKGSQTVSATFKDIVPGKYEVSSSKEEWCWESKSVIAEVNIENVEVGLKQSGYLLTVSSSHATLINYVIKGDKNSKGSIDVEKGATRKCLTTPGVYTFTPVGCHMFAAPNYLWKTSDQSLLSLVAVKHTLTGVIKSTQPGSFKINVLHQDESTTLLGPLEKLSDSSSVNVYKFEFLATEKEEITLTPQASDDLFQYKPTTLSLSAPSDCTENVAEFSAEKALFINGKVTPPVAGVQITVSPVDDETVQHVFTTDKDGKYTAGPLDNNLKYDVTASLTGYTVTALDTVGNFEAFKLAEVIVKIVDEAKSPLGGVVVSMSGGKSYRQNSLTGEDGSYTFHSLLPGEYFLRFAMKEYNFQPPTKMVAVQQGDTINVSVSGVRVAYSALGQVTSLNGIPEGDVSVEALGQGPDCAEYQEDSMSNDDGSFRIRGLLPKCKYVIGLKAGDGFNKHIERMLPPTTAVQVQAEDITGLHLVVLRHFNQLDVVGSVDTEKEFLNTLSIRVYRDDVSDSPIHTIKITDHPFFMLPPMLMDGKTYTLQLESTLPQDHYIYRKPEISFTADMSFKSVKFSFKPTLRNMEAEMNHNTMAGLLLAITIITVMFNYEKIAPAIDWVFDIIAHAITNRGGTLDTSSRAQMFQQQPQHRFKPRKIT